MSLLLKIDLYNTQKLQKLKWKLFTKGIKRPSKEGWVWIDSVLLKKKRRHFNLERVENVSAEVNIDEPSQNHYQIHLP